MTKRASAKSETLEEALRQALAEVAEADEEDVDIDVDVQGFDLSDLRDVRVQLEYDLDSADGGEDSEDEDDEEDADEATEGVSIDELDEEADASADFLEGLLDAVGLPGDLQIRVHDDHAEVEVVNIGSGQLIGRRGQTLDAIQELLRCAIQRRFERRCRVIIDIEGYRQRRLEKLLDKAAEAVEDALETGEEQRLEPMDVYERKAIHHLVAEREGVTSSSRGREPTRRVIIEAE
jgi:spoIIIJ-associated protein